MLKIEDIHTYYGSSHVLQGVSLEVEEHQAVGLLGRNGVGKTTLVRSVMGLTPAARGHVLFKEDDITKANSYSIARKGIGYVPQGRMIFPSLTVFENLSVAYRENVHGENDWTIEKVLELFPRLKERMKNHGNQLSGGEQQMLAIGRALVTNPDLLIMDEPTEGLAPVIVSEVLGNLFKVVKEMGYPILLVEQDLQFTLKHVDKVFILSGGRITYHGKPEELARDTEAKYKYLGI